MASFANGCPIDSNPTWKVYISKVYISWPPEQMGELELELEREREREREQREREREQREREREREQERERERARERARELAKQLRRRLRKQLTLLKDVITRDILLTKNLHSLREYLRFNLRDWSHSLKLSAGHASLCLVFGNVRLVHLGRAVRNCL
jgi:hypothetical protein